VLLDVGLVQGWFGFNFGVNGIALSTTLCRLCAFSAILIGSIYKWQQQGVWFAKIRREQFIPDGITIRQLLGIGIPSFGLLAGDVLAFNLLTFLAAQLGVIPLAAHQIMFMVTCITVMVPIGISNAACIRIGQLTGEGDLGRALVSCRIHILCCLCCMSITGLVLLSYPTFIVQWFTDDPLLVSTVIPLMQLCGLLQIADGMQIVFAGLLRAYGQVKRVFIYSLVAHYGIGLPIGLIASFKCDMGVLGLWGGVTIALFSMWIFNWMLSRDMIK
jgi:MATE family multidrug resistance protein